jgi:lysozyme
MMQMSQAGLDKLTKPWEEFVGYVYDDKRPKEHIDGKWQYPEWKGGPVRGTLTIFWGHTDAAGVPKIVQGMRGDEAQGEAVLMHDIAPCVARVNRFLKVQVSQHVFDAIVDLDFNCPSATAHICGLINAGNRAGAERAMMQYINSRGERMEGLVHRRTAEIAWMNTPDDPDVAAATVISPKAEREPAPSSMATSKTGSAAIATASAGAGSVIAGLQAANDAADVVKTSGHHINEVRDTIGTAGLLDHVLAHSSAALIIGGCIVIALAVFIWLDRRYRLVNFHV